MLEELERELYILVNNIEYHGHNYEDYNDIIEELVTKIETLKKLDSF